MLDVLAFGSVVIDNVLVVRKFPAVNETVQVDKYRYTYGGAGANVAVAAARLGAKSGIFAVAGSDFKKTNYEKHLEKEGVDRRGLIPADFLMPRSFIVSKESSDDQILYYYENRKGTAKKLFENMELALRLGNGSQVCHFSTGHFEFYYRLLKGGRLKSVVSFDPGQETFNYPYRVVRIIPYVHMLFMNNHEAKRIKELLKIKSLRQIEGPKLLCVSLGAQGSVILFKGEVYRIPAVRPSRLIDPTGAGDSHRAGFIVALLKGYDVKTAGRIASTVASFTIEAEGAQTSLPTWEKVVRRYEHFFKEKFPQPQTSWEETKRELLS
ncbi:PfkB family carbohydrate kinase [Thermovibrio ammonificans]|jgi:ribokinase